jgi:hypothetical protein
MLPEARWHHKIKSDHQKIMTPDLQTVSQTARPFQLIKDHDATSLYNGITSIEHDLNRKTAAAQHSVCKLIT